MKNKIQDIFLKNNLNITIDQAAKLEKYFNMVIEKNKVMNLTAITEEEEFIIKHFLDSSLVLKFVKFKNNDKILDMGTGAGFPGIVLAILLENVEFVLIDSLKKRIDFLNTVKEELSLDNVKLVHARAEDKSIVNYRETFDFVVSRAVAKLPTLLEYTVPFIKVDGKVLAYKSIEVENELIESKNAMKELFVKLEKKYSIELYDINRNILQFVKLKKTNMKYPRSGNKPRTMPL